MSSSATPIRKIHVSDQGRFGFARIDAAEQGLAAMGYVVPNRILGTALWSKLQGGGGIDISCPAQVARVTAAAAAVTLEISTAETAMQIDTRLVVAADALKSAGLPVIAGATWTTDAPFRETVEAIEAAKRRGMLAVEMEAAALYAFAAANKRRVLCLAHVTNTMGQTKQDFEKGEADGTADALAVLDAIARCLAKLPGEPE